MKLEQFFSHREIIGRIPSKSVWSDFLHCQLDMQDLWIWLTLLGIEITSLDYSIVARDFIHFHQVKSGLPVESGSGNPFLNNSQAGFLWNLLVDFLL